MKTIYKLISILLCMIMAFSVCACNLPSGDSSNPGTPPTQEQTPGSGNEESGPDADDVVESFTSTISYDPEDYVGDLETFVYGLLITKLEYIYDVFPAYIQLSSGYFVYGLAYTDYSECYTTEDETVAYFMSGFLPFVGELEIPQEDFDSGLYEAIALKTCVEKRVSEGGTGFKSIDVQIKGVNEYLKTFNA
jgi:hypothetical protein